MAGKYVYSVIELAEKKLILWKQEHSRCSDFDSICRLFYADLPNVNRDDFEYFKIIPWFFDSIIHFADFLACAFCFLNDMKIFKSHIGKTKDRLKIFMKGGYLASHLLLATGIFESKADVRKFPLPPRVNFEYLLPEIQRKPFISAFHEKTFDISSICGDPKTQFEKMSDFLSSLEEKDDNDNIFDSNFTESMDETVFGSHKRRKLELDPDEHSDILFKPFTFQDELKSSLLHDPLTQEKFLTEPAKPSNEDVSKQEINVNLEKGLDEPKDLLSNQDFYKEKSDLNAEINKESPNTEIFAEKSTEENPIHLKVVETPAEKSTEENPSHLKVFETPQFAAVTNQNEDTEDVTEIILVKKAAKGKNYWLNFEKVR